MLCITGCSLLDTSRENMLHDSLVINRIKINLNVKENESISSWKLVTISVITRVSNDFSLGFTKVQVKIQSCLWLNSTAPDKLNEFLKC